MRGGIGARKPQSAHKMIGESLSALGSCALPFLHPHAPGLSHWCTIIGASPMVRCRFFMQAQTILHRPQSLGGHHLSLPVRPLSWLSNTTRSRSVVAEKNTFAGRSPRRKAQPSDKFWLGSLRGFISL